MRRRFEASANLLMGHGKCQACARFVGMMDTNVTEIRHNDTDNDEVITQFSDFFHF